MNMVLYFWMLFLIIKKKNMPLYYPFTTLTPTEHVFDENQDNEVIFDKLARPLIREYLEGKNGMLKDYEYISALIDVAIQ